LREAHDDAEFTTHVIAHSIWLYLQELGDELHLSKGLQDKAEEAEKEIYESVTILRQIAINAGKYGGGHTRKRHYKHPKKGRKSRTHKGRKDFTTKKT
jgi:hypothetical protein